MAVAGADVRSRQRDERPAERTGRHGQTPLSGMLERAHVARLAAAWMIPKDILMARSPTAQASR